MWFSALLGMALTYSENVLALRYARTLPDGRRVSGPMAYLRFGLHSRVLAAFYAVCCVAASLGMGNMTQSSAISTLAKQAFSLPPLWTAVGVAVLLGIILLRGTSCTGKVIQWLMPLLSAVYLLAALGVIVTHHDALPGAFRDIFCGAFGIRAVGGGISGAVLKQAVQTGLRHGIFSNEAGLGSSALVHAGGSSEDAALQGMWSMVEVALDTLVCCTLTALAILTSGALTQADHAGAIITAAFSGIFGSAAPEVMAILTALFAFCTLIGWCCCGEQAVRYLGGERLRLPIAAVLPVRRDRCGGVAPVGVGALGHCQRTDGDSQSAGTGAAGLACQRQTPRRNKPQKKRRTPTGIRRFFIRFKGTVPPGGTVIEEFEMSGTSTQKGKLCSQSRFT